MNKEFYNLKGENLINLNTKEYWNEVYKNTPIWGGCKQGADELDIIISNLVTGKKMLEIGCGRKNLAYELYKLGYDITAIDISNVVVDMLKKEYPEVDYIEMDARELKFEDETFDFIYSEDLLEHFPETQVAIQEWLRVLKTGGYMLIGTVSELWEDHPQHCRKFNIKTLSEDLGIDKEIIVLHNTKTLTFLVKK